MVSSFRSFKSFDRHIRSLDTLCSLNYTFLFSSFSDIFMQPMLPSPSSLLLLFMYFFLSTFLCRKIVFFFPLALAVSSTSSLENNSFARSHSGLLIIRMLKGRCHAIKKAYRLSLLNEWECKRKSWNNNNKQ